MYFIYPEIYNLFIVEKKELKAKFETLRSKIRNEIFTHLVIASEFFKKYFVYLVLERGEKREKERERNINVWLPLVHPLLETWPVPWQGIKPATLWFTGQHSIHWATPVRAASVYLTAAWWEWIRGICPESNTHYPCSHSVPKQDFQFPSSSVPNFWTAYFTFLLFAIAFIVFWWQVLSV